MSDNDEKNNEQRAVTERREFLRKAGRFAAVTPPVITMMLSVSDKAKAQIPPSGLTF